MDVDVNKVLELGIALLTTGALGGAIIFIGNAWRKGKAAWTENQDLRSRLSALFEVGKELSEEGEILARQILALSKAVDDSDKAADRIQANEELRTALLQAAANFSEGEQKALIQLMTPVKAGVREYAGMETDKLTALKESMDKSLTARETRNKIMTNSAKLAELVIKTGITTIPKMVK
jgi:hypothetical protein